MDETRVRRVSLGLNGLLFLCAIGFLDFVSTDYGPTPRWPGVVFVATGLYCVVCFRSLTIQARGSYHDRESTPVVDTLVYGFPTSWIPPLFAPWLLAILLVGMGIAMLMH